MVNPCLDGIAVIYKYVKIGAAHVGVARVVDSRLDVLTDVLKPQKTIPITEGKTYIVWDGDVVTFLFNI